MHDGAVSRRNSLRKPGHDYRQPGIYFITVETEAMQRLFGHVLDGHMVLSGAGNLVAQRWEEVPRRFPSVEADDFVVMPDHLHGVLILRGTGAESSSPPSVGEVVRWLKTSVMRRYRDGVERDDWEPYAGRLWRDDYHDRIITSAEGLTRARAYMRANPARWWAKRGPTG